jgi:hypothetical protein
MKQRLLRPRDYIDVLDALHISLMPRTYVEIGVASGKSMSLALPGSVLVGIDPEPKVRHPISGSLRLFSETSDDFFAKRSLREVIGGQPVDMAFIDGLHHFDVVLRDFRNLEAAGSSDSVILIHDCLPLSVSNAKRERETDAWAGDVWKAIVGLRRHRPDLTISVHDAAPTGLAIITGLDPTSRVLFDQYEAIVDELSPMQLPEAPVARRQLIGAVAAEWSTIFGQVPAKPYREASVDQLIEARSRRPPTIDNVLWKFRRKVRFSRLGPAALAAKRIARRRPREEPST